MQLQVWDVAILCNPTQDDGQYEADKAVPYLTFPSNFFLCCVPSHSHSSINKVIVALLCDGAYWSGLAKGDDESYPYVPSNLRENVNSWESGFLTYQIGEWSGLCN